MIKINRTVKAVTLVELIAVIMILGLAVSALMGLLTQVTRTAWFDEDIAKASFCAQTGMERVRSEKNFTNIVSNAAVSCFPGLIYTITVNDGTLSGDNWTAGINSTYKIVNVTGTKQSSSTAVSLYTLISNCSGTVCF